MDVFLTVDNADHVYYRMAITLSSLERMLERNKRPVSDLLRDMAREEREANA